MPVISDRILDITHIHTTTGHPDSDSSCLLSDKVNDWAQLGEKKKKQAATTSFNMLSIPFFTHSVPHAA
jgi:hypothetical protein